MLPVSHAGHNFAFHIRHYTIPVFGLRRRIVGYQFAQVSRLDARRDSSGFDVVHVVAYVLDHFFSTASELIAIHSGRDRALVSRYRCHSSTTVTYPDLTQ